MAGGPTFLLSTAHLDHESSILMWKSLLTGALYTTLSYPSLLLTPILLPLFIKNLQYLLQNFLSHWSVYKEDSSETLASQYFVLRSSSDSHPSCTNFKLTLPWTQHRPCNLPECLSLWTNNSDHTLLTYFLTYHLIRISSALPPLISTHLATLPILPFFLTFCSTLPLPPWGKLFLPGPLINWMLLTPKETSPSLHNLAPSQHVSIPLYPPPCPVTISSCHRVGSTAS